ncbi:MAG: helix-turn-helix domain-containing protein [Bacteroidetes bacterium]|nr:helix-turn-helix domain-containing protein [Bacteroidota bacterium]
MHELKGFSQEAVALYLGISQQAFQQIETGKTKAI